jgi:hypothetical protein
VTPHPTVYRVIWVPGTDELLGQCHCGAERITGDPIEMWAWLLAHPDGHAAVTEAKPPLRVPAMLGSSG